jgi:glycosyltransferase involved in cell wall biosynthesis
VAELTVGLPVFNDPDGLRRSVPTVFAQTWDGPLRLLVIDDGSTDETPQVLAELADRYGRIEVVRNDANRGRPAARNQVLEHAGDGYLAWLDADDLWHPRKLELQFQALERAGTRKGPVLCTCPIRFSWLGRGMRRQKPELAGDQLRNVLTGELYPYLWAMLGRAQDFRDAGGFDERLPRRQDYEFLVRFVARGGRVVSTRGSTPLATYIKSDVGRSPREVAASNKVIAREHAELFRRYGRRFARARRAERMLLVARYHENNDQMALARLFQARAHVYDPLEWAVRTRAATEAVRLARRAKALPRAAKQRVSSRGPSAGSGGPVVATAAPIADVVARARRGVEAGEHDEVVRLLEGTLEQQGSLPAEGWYLLSEGVRGQRDLDRALEVLRRGLAAHPEDVALEVRLTELHVIREEWSTAIERWGWLRDAAEHHTARTYLLLARAHRVLGDHEAAHVVAAAGTARFPADTSIRAELYRARTAAVDWAKAIVLPPPPSMLDEGASQDGVVTELGFLVGADAALTGTVAPRFGRAPLVSLRVNDKPVATTHAATPVAGAEGTFSFRCDAMLEYLGDGDIITVDCDRAPLSFAGVAPRAVVLTGYPGRANELLERVGAGHVFTKFGRLRQGNTATRKQRTLALFDDVAAVIERELATSVSPFYGNLLGAIRDNDFIKHDVGGFDMGYVSRHATPGAVKAEFLTLCRTLLAEGYDLRLEPWGVMVRDHPADPYFVDVNYAWFSPEGELHLSFGWRYPPVTDRAGLEAPRSCPIGGHLVTVPGNAEQVLEQVYGPNWPVPDQGFDLDAHLRRDLRYLLTVGELEQLRAEAPERVRIEDVLDADGEVVPYEG